MATFPAGHLILKERRRQGDEAGRGTLSWNILDAAGACSNVGFHYAPPAAQRATAHQAVATDLASVITLANELRAALVEKGLIKGES